MGDAFAAIDNGGKLRKPDELPFEICFGGRRQFCNSDYADLGEIHSTVSILYLLSGCQFFFETFSCPFKSSEVNVPLLIVNGSL